MEYNPFTGPLAAKQQAVQLINDRVRELSQILTWHSGFDSIAEAKALAVDELKAEQIRSKLEDVKRAREAEAGKERDLTRKAKIGLDPRRWFSTERIELAKQRNASRARIVSFNTSISNMEAEVIKVLRKCEQRQEQLAKYRTLDPQEITAELNTLESRLADLLPALARLQLEKQRVDALLSPLLKERNDLSGRIEVFRKDIELAEDFADRLSSAENSYERAEIHRECSETFNGEGSPNRVKQEKHREIHALDRNLRKIESRLERLAHMASRRISTLIIDGNNLCYAGSEFIGLAALYELIGFLAGSYRVILVFDASICRLLRMNEQQIRHKFPTDVLVHIVASENAADQTVLEAAVDSDSYVISNDRFRDFTDKAAVIERRLIQHEILAGKLLINDLNLVIPFKHTSREFRDDKGWAG